ncbi:hypothetical protein BJX99DRAFT_255886 [Aspergillus californicus]
MANPEEALASDQLNPDDRPSTTSNSQNPGSSNGSFIYNALRESSGTGEETEPRAQARNNRLERVDSRMAANIAMFCSLSTESAPSRPSEVPSRLRNNTDHVGRPPRAYIMADKLRLASTGDMVAWTLPDNLHPSFVEHQKQNNIEQYSSGISPDDAGQSVQGLNPSPDIAGPSKWPTNVKSPVSPALPDFPPPVRSSTPPGLPSFGTEEARNYDFRIGAQPPVPTRGDSMLRRLFSRASPSPSQSQRKQQSRPRIFAEDGTAVLGSFPQRQSGHGTNVLRGLDDHPFHQRNIALSQYDGTNTERAGAVFGELDNAASPFTPRVYGSSEEDLVSLEQHLNREVLRGIPLREERLHSQPLSPQSTPHTRDSALSGPDNSTNKAEPPHTCASGIQEAGTPRHVERLGNSAFSDPCQACSLEQTQSAAPSALQETANTQETSGTSSGGNSRAVYWLQFKRRVSFMLCCCPVSVEERERQSPQKITGAEANSNTIANTVTNTATNTDTYDTYLTARDQVSNESQHPPSGAAGGQPGP